MAKKKIKKLCSACKGGKKKRINNKTGKLIPCKVCKGTEVITV